MYMVTISYSDADDEIVGRYPTKEKAEDTAYDLASEEVNTFRVLEVVAEFKQLPGKVRVLRPCGLPPRKTKRKAA